MLWNSATKQRLFSLWEARNMRGEPMFSKIQIAAQMGISHQAVIAKLGRARVAGEIVKRTPAVVLPTERFTDGGRRVAIHPGSRKRPPILGPTLSSIPRAPPTGEPIAPATSCQYPLWPDATLPPRPPAYCGCGCVELRSGAGDLQRLAYCREHALVCYPRLSRVA